METIEFTIPLNPRSKKNSQEIVRPKGRPPIIVQSKVYKEYEKACREYVPEMPIPIDFPVNVQYLFYRKDERRCDATNLQAALDDILVKYGVLADDNWKIIKSHDGTRVLLDRENPRVEVTITEVE